MSSTHGRSSSHAPSRPPSVHRLSSHHRTLSTEYRRHSQSLQSSRDAPSVPVAHKRRSEHGILEDTKRRRPNDGMLSAGELLKPSIVVRAHPPNPSSRPCTLLPLMLLPREHLPLSSLDLAAPKGDLPNSRLFQSEIHILELEGRLGSSVLIARSPSSNTGSSGGFSSASSIFAIERDEAGLYVLCKLGSWVNIQRLSENATAVCRQRMPAVPKEAASTEAHTLITLKAHKEQGKKRLAIAELQSIVKRKPASQAAAEASPAPDVDALAQTPIDGPDDGANDLPTRPLNQTSAHGQAVSSLKEAALPTPPASDSTKVAPVPQNEPLDDGPPTADGIFLNIRHQYWETLYHSMGSLAYFAKGPLSRARAAFHLDCDANLEMDHLIDFLKSLVLTTTVIDKKYRETVPEIVARLRTLGSLSDDEPKRKSKKPKKIRLGSNGLYTDEDTHIRKWWDANKPPPRDDEVFARNEEVRYVVSCLRTRETQMQMILILEIMALEAMQPASDAVESQLPGMTPTADVLATTPAKKDAPRKRSKHNLPLLIDVHADRLCIWQSTVSDEVRALAESQPRANSDLSYSQTSQSLADFCVDIVVPFFYPRLPLVCDALNRKLGGPVIATPSSRSKTSSSTKSPSAAKSREKLSSSKHHQRAKPGSSLRRAASTSHSARSLERVLSSEKLRRSVSRGPNDAIAQMRSATAAPIPGLKREMSEPLPLANVPRRASSTSLKDRDRPTSTLARGSSDVNVRVDDTRARKKALVEAQLHDAISALKKPNREMAGKAIVEDSEKRLYGVTGALKKIKKAGRSLAAGGDHRIQVKATPVNNRFRDVFVSTSTEAHSLFGGSQPHFGQPQLFSHSHDTGSLFAPHSQQHEFVVASPRVAATPSAGRIQATPMRASAACVPDSAIRAASALPSRGALVATAGNSVALPEDEDRILMSSPVAVRRAPALASTQVDFSKSFSGPISSFRQVATSRTVVAATDRIPGSSPLQARTQPMPMAMERAHIFETPTKARVRAVHREEDTFSAFAAGSIMATPPAIRPAAVNTVAVGGMGNSVESLYQQMGWDDDLDDLA